MTSSIRQKVEYALLRSLVFMLALPPRPIARALGSMLGTMVWLTGIRRAVLAKNLAIAFPDHSPKEHRRVARKSIEHFGRTLIDLAGLHRWTPTELKSRTRLENFHWLEQALEAGKGAIIATGHIGAVDVGPARLQLEGYDVLSIYQRVRNPLVDRFITRIRTIGNARVAARGFGLRAALKTLRHNGVILILGDQDAGADGLFVPFFSQPASTLVGPAEFALRTGATLLTGYVFANGDRFILRIEEPIPHTSVDDMMVEYNRRLERAIRLDPTQYFWLHKRWKTPPPATIGEAP